MEVVGRRISVKPCPVKGPNRPRRGRGGGGGEEEEEE